MMSLVQILGIIIVTSILASPDIPCKKLLQRGSRSTEHTLSFTYEGKNFKAKRGLFQDKSVLIIEDEQGKEHVLIKERGRWIERRSWQRRMLDMLREMGLVAGRFAVLSGCYMLRVVAEKHGHIYGTDSLIEKISETMAEDFDRVLGVFDLLNSRS